MAVISISTEIDVGERRELTWGAMAASDTGTPYTINGQRALAGSVQVIGGTAGSVGVEVSNNGTNWAPLADMFGTVINLTALTQVADFTTAALYIRPAASTGASGAIVKMVFRG